MSSQEKIAPEDRHPKDKIVELARFDMTTHGTHCDCDLCSAFYELDYPSKDAVWLRAPSEREKAREAVVARVADCIALGWTGGNIGLLHRSFDELHAIESRGDA